MKKTRKNLLVGIDNRNGEPEVVILQTTSTDDVIIKFTVQTDKMAIHIDDLQEALDQIKEFNASRPPQPKIERPISTGHIEEMGQKIEIVQKVEQELELGN